VGGQPVLQLLLRRLRAGGFERVILSVGYRAEQVRERFGDEFEGLRLDYCVEQTPLGTGGAARKALAMGASAAPFVMNGDTLVDLDYRDLAAAHAARCAKVSIAVVQVSDCARFGRVVTDGERITGFMEKGTPGPGPISSGVYVIDAGLFAAYPLGAAFSLEKDFFVPYVERLRPLAYFTSGRFIDIGVPEDLKRAQLGFQ
jgi:D-glycero-alpha-D-manno-heptose 1-phosphate guanylyltransferase